MRLFFVIFVIFLLYNGFTLLVSGDDLVYSYIWNFTNLLEPIPEDATKISSFYDLFISVKNHYFTWCGRILGDSLTMFFAWIGKHWFNLCNAFISTVLLYLIVGYSNKGIITFYKNKSVLFVFVCLWLFQLQWNSIFLWLPGSCCYVWTTTFYLLFCLPYLQEFHQTKCNFINSLENKHCSLFTVLFFFFGIISGLTSEVPIAYILFLLSLFLWYLYKNKQLKSWHLSGFIGLLLGYCILMFCPATHNRLLAEIEYGINTLEPFNKEILYPIFTNLQNGKSWFSSITYSFIVNKLDYLCLVISFQLCFWLFICYYLFVSCKNKQVSCLQDNNDKINYTSYEDNIFIRFVILGAFACETIMIFSPTFPPRTTFFSNILLIISSLIIIRNNYHKKLLQHLVVRCIIYLLSIVFIASFIFNSYALVLNYNLSTQWLNDIKKLDAKSSETIEVRLPYNSFSLFRFSKNHVMFDYLNEDENSWFNVSFQRYYHLKNKIKAIHKNKKE